MVVVLVVVVGNRMRRQKTKDPLHLHLWIFANVPLTKTSQRLCSSCVTHMQSHKPKTVDRCKPNS